MKTHCRKFTRETFRLIAHDVIPVSDINPSDAYLILITQSVECSAMLQSNVSEIVTEYLICLKL